MACLVFETKYYWDTRAALVALRADAADICVGHSEARSKHIEELGYLLDDLGGIGLHTESPRLAAQCAAAIAEFTALASIEMAERDGRFAGAPEIDCNDPAYIAELARLMAVAESHSVS